MEQKPSKAYPEGNIFSDYFTQCHAVHTNTNTTLTVLSFLWLFKMDEIKVSQAHIKIW